MDCSPPDSFVHGISQARILEWFVISFSRRSSRPRDWSHISCIGRWVLYYWATREAPEHKLAISSVQLLSHVRLFATPWIAARQASLSITNSRSHLILWSSPSPPAPDPSQHQSLFQCNRQYVNMAMCHQNFMDAKFWILFNFHIIKYSTQWNTWTKHSWLLC